MSIADIGGWIGTALVLIAFAYVTFRKDPDVWFQLANGFGAVLLGLDGLSHNAMPVVGLNLAWCIIAVVGLGRLWHQAYTDTVRLERETIRANLLAYNGIPIVRDEHCPPGSVFLVDRNWIAHPDVFDRIRKQTEGTEQ